MIQAIIHVTKMEAHPWFASNDQVLPLLGPTLHGGTVHTLLPSYAPYGLTQVYSTLNRPQSMQPLTHAHHPLHPIAPPTKWKHPALPPALQQIQHCSCIFCLQTLESLAS